MLLNLNAFKNCNETRNEDYILQECYIISIIYYSKKYHYATNRQVAGSIPDGVIGIFQ